MHFSKLLPLTLLGAAAAAPIVEEVDAEYERAVQFVKRQYPVMACSHKTGGIHVLALGGANTNNPKDYGLLGSLAGKILYAIPGSTNVSVPYDKQFISTTPPTLSPNAVPDGMKTLKAYTVQYHNSCPNTKIAIIGYSSGGVIMMNDLCYGGNGQGTPQINPLLSGGTIFGIVAYGEETRVGGESFNVGTCPQTYSATHPRANPSLCAPFAGLIRSYCDTGDPDCCVGSPNPNVAIHLSYPTTYDVEATQFIVNQLAAHGGA